MDELIRKQKQNILCRHGAVVAADVDTKPNNVVLAYSWISIKTTDETVHT